MTRFISSRFFDRAVTGQATARREPVHYVPPAKHSPAKGPIVPHVHTAAIAPHGERTPGPVRYGDKPTTVVVTKRPLIKAPR